MANRRFFPVGRGKGWGSGFRYLITRRYGLYTGIDIAFSDSEQALYFNVGTGL